MQLPIIDPMFIETSDAHEHEVFHSYSKGICPRCRELVDGVRILRAGKVYLRKQCPRDGRSEALISGDADWFLKSLTYITKGSIPLKHSTKVAEGCPKDCGLCPDHEQHSCLPIIEITNHCNLECPICIVQNKNNYTMSRDEFVATIDGLAEKEGALDTVNLSGGEPTIHPLFLEFCDIARRPEISRVSVSTNGLRIATDFEFCRELARKNIYVNLQPAAYTGYGGSHFGPHDPLNVITIPDVVRCAEEQTGGLLRKSDFLPLPCSHPGCFGLTYLLKTDAGFIPFPRFIELDKYLEIISNRGTIRPDEGFEDTLKATIDQLWSSAGQIPDSDRILGTLKKALSLMYPEERVLELEERLHIGEGLVKTIFIHAFMDEHTFEVDRIKKCCTHYALPDGRLMPGCAYNMFYRHIDPRMSGPVGEAKIWGKTGK